MTRNTGLNLWICSLFEADEWKKHRNVTFAIIVSLTKCLFKVQEQHFALIVLPANAEISILPWGEFFSK